MKHKNLIRLFLALATVFFLLSISGEAISANKSSSIATVQKASGTATVVREGQTIPAKIGLELYENDTLLTGRDGSMGVVFNDETLLSLGPESLLVIDEFVFAPRQGKFSIAIRMVKGTVAYLSGLITKLAPESTHFQTPTSSIGIRGTKFVAKVEGE
ncbi:MAG TPA: FecR domain-containing protein [Thermodesulfobacteriota bacterium]|nr:FecR domain-containing protein [Thermodesulfobacteriota bacterium]